MPNNNNYKMTTNMQDSQSDILTFVEKVNVTRCRQILKLDKDEFTSQFWDKNEINQDGKKSDFKYYLIQVKKYCMLMIENEGVLKQKYKYGASSNNKGRIYVIGFGIQSLQHRLRNFLIEGIYKDIDIVNCHPNIIYDLCVANKISCSILKNYVQNRSAVLSDEDITKFDILIAINTDVNKNKNDYISMFHREITKIKKEINDLHKDLFQTTNSEKNKKSSYFNRVISMYENIILQNAMKQHIEYVGVPMFDGFLIDVNHKFNISDLNQKSIKFIEKPVVNNIELDELNENERERTYFAQKKLFELEHFQVLKTNTFHKLLTEADGSRKWAMYKKNEFKDVVADYWYFDDEGKRANFLQTWIEDDKRRFYVDAAFIPYYKNSPTYVKDLIFNTFEEWKSEKSENIVDTSIFDDLLFELCGQEQEAKDYLFRYIAHIFQYPEIRPDISIVMRGTQGVGKDTLIDIIIALMGHKKYCFRTENQEEVFGTFNETIMDSLILQFNETEGKDGVKNQEKIKGLITKDALFINVKNKTKMDQSNYLRIFFISNNKCPILIPYNDRRFMVIKATDKYYNNLPFFEKVRALMKNREWMNSLFTRFVSEDLSKFNIKIRPKTKVYEEMKEDNINPVYRYLRELCDKKKFKNGWIIKTEQGAKSAPVDTYENDCSDDSDDDDDNDDNDEKLYAIEPAKFCKKYLSYCEQNNLYDQIKYFKRVDLKRNLSELKHVIVDRQIRYDGKNPTRVFIFDFKKLKEHLNELYFTNDEDIIEW